MLPLPALFGQAVRIRTVPTLSYPVSIVDGNSPSVWVDGVLRVYTSTGDLLAMTGTSLAALQQSQSPSVTPRDHYPIWIESVWRDTDGVIYGWYHHEPAGICTNLTAPKIGAVVSEDGGLTFRDLGIVIATGYPLNCGAANGFFAGGHGDLSVILDREQQYFYFLFDNYSGPLQHQGVAIARMRFEDRANPVGAVSKYYLGAWEEPGIGGMVTPIFPAAASWESSTPDAFWGPSIHWNTHLNTYVALLNHSCCKSGWPQEGIYLSMADDLSDPGSWSLPVKILDDSAIGFAPGYYPQVVGVEEGGTDSLAGGTARLFVKGVSKWEIVFLNPEEIPPPVDSTPGPDDEDPTEPKIFESASARLIRLRGK